MTNREKLIVGAIYGLASDKRGRVIVDDEIKWLKKKLKEIRRLSTHLPRIKWDRTDPLLRG